MKHEKREVGDKCHVPDFPFCQLFAVHSSKLKPHPIGNLSQTSVVGITHTMLFFGVGKDPLNGFFAFCVKVLIFRGVSGVIDQFLCE